MKLIRFGAPGQERPGVLVQDRRYDTSAFFDDYDERFFAEDGLARLRRLLEQRLDALPQVAPEVRLGAPVARPSKIICIGLNYEDHARETNAPIPEEPIVFFKSTTALCGPDDPLVIPRGSVKTDWEVELAVVIGKTASYVDEAAAMEHVAGYSLFNDYSERSYQLERGGNWSKGKGCDSFGPLGPWLATPDEVADVHALNMWLTVNGKTYQSSSTRQLIFRIPYLVHYLSQFFTLLPGDIISTGTPPGVGLGVKPEPVYVRPGDVIALGIDGLGSSRQVARAYGR